MSVTNPQVQVIVRMPPGLRKRLRKLAEKRLTNVAALIRALVLAELAKERK